MRDSPLLIGSLRLAAGALVWGTVVGAAVAGAEIAGEGYLALGLHHLALETLGDDLRTYLLVGMVGGVAALLLRAATEPLARRFAPWSVAWIAMAAWLLAALTPLVWIWVRDHRSLPPERENHEPPLLYHLGEDIGEQWNVAEDQAEKLAAMLERVAEHERSFDPPPPLFDLGRDPEPEWKLP